jgi:hypothetical protein
MEEGEGCIEGEQEGKPSTSGKNTNEERPIACSVRYKGGAFPREKQEGNCTKTTCEEDEAHEVSNIGEMRSLANIKEKAGAEWHKEPTACEQVAHECIGERMSVTGRDAEVVR